MHVVGGARKEQLVESTNGFLSALAEGAFEIVWDDLISDQSVELISNTVIPNFLDQNQQLSSISLDFETIGGLLYAFQTDSIFPGDTTGIRQGFFDGLNDGFAKMGWHEGINADGAIVFLHGDAAMVCADSRTSHRLIILPFVWDSREDTYKVDLIAFQALSGTIQAEELFMRGANAEQMDHPEVASLYYELTYQLEAVYGRLKVLIVDNLLGRHIFTEERRLHLEKEYAFCKLARIQGDKRRQEGENTASSTKAETVVAHIFPGLEKASELQISNEEYDYLDSLTDQQIRDALASVIKGGEKYQVLRESEKPHSGYELSDIDFRITINGVHILVSIPIKSSRELKSKVMSVDYFHQLAKPQLTLGSNVVILVTTTRISESLSNLIRMANDRLGWQIAAVERHQLAQLLKYHELLKP